MYVLATALFVLGINVRVCLANLSAVVQLIRQYFDEPVGIHFASDELLGEEPCGEALGNSPAERTDFGIMS